MGCMKPDAEIYKRAEELLGAQGREIVFFDDRPENVTEALAHGWQAVLYRSVTDVSSLLS